MLVSKIKFAALLLCVHFEWSKAKKCSDCIPLQQCNEAFKLSRSLTDDNVKLLARSYCGYSTSTKVCCSDFDPLPSIQNVPKTISRLGLTHEDTEMDLKEVPTSDNSNSEATTEHPSIRLLPNSCGDIGENRIMGGRIADLYEYPWMVLISYYTDDGLQFKCAGTLINTRYVLTAAHCVVGLDIAGVRIGEYDIRYEVDCLKGVCEENKQDRRIEQPIVHEEYRGYQNNFVDDIALLRLKRRVSLMPKNAGIICLPITEELRRSPITGMNGTVAGWGLTESDKESSVLLKVTIPVSSPDDCKNFYSHSQMNDPDPLQFCAGTTNKDSCRGDSGGPLMIKKMYQGSLKYVQYGIVSNGPGHCGRSTPGLYTDVRKYVDWILNKIKE